MTARKCAAFLMILLTLLAGLCLAAQADVVITEVMTDNAYTLLKSPVQVVISKSGTTVSATVDGNAVTMSAIGTSGHALAPFSVINTRGFDLPQTGGTGNWLFPVVGLSVFALSMLGIYLIFRSRKETASK